MTTSEPDPTTTPERAAAQPEPVAPGDYEPVPPVEPAPEAAVESNPDGAFESEAPVLPPWWVGYDTMLAVAAFVILFRWGGGLVPAIAAITVVSVVSAILRVRHGIGIGKLLPLVTISIVARGIVGIVTDNDDIYFGIGIGYKFAIAAALVLSVPLRRNPGEEVLARVLGLPAAMRSHKAYRAAVDRIVVVLGLIVGISAGFDIWFLGVTDPDEYVLFRYIISWPLYVGFTIAGLIFLGRRMARIPGFPGVMRLLERQAELRAAARKR